MNENEDNKILTEQDRLIAELMLRVATLEKLLIDNKIITADEYQQRFNEAVDKLKKTLENEVKIKSGEFKN